jgi:hypothetical protein
LTPNYTSILEQLLGTKRRIFVSYHHHGDQAYYNAFSQTYCSQGYDVIQDNSLRDARDSDDPQYVMQSIRENNISGTSCTIVLCGPSTYGRKYVDWEIKGTLDKEHGLIGVQLPTAFVNPLTNNVSVPDRLHENVQTGYALWITWAQLMGGPDALKTYIENSLNAVTRPKRLITNRRDMMRRNTAP